MDPLGPYAPLLFKELWGSNFNDRAKSLKIPLFVIPAKAGIQYFQLRINTPERWFRL
jgi:hypothetical protein